MSTPKILAQQTPAGVSAEAFYTPTSGYSIVKEVVICNQSAAAAVYTVYLDAAGSSYADASAMFDAIDIPAHSTDRIQNCFWPLVVGDNLAVKSGTASAITYTALGEEFP